MSLSKEQLKTLIKEAASIEPLARIGKNKVSEAFLEDLENLLNAHELVKVKVLNNAGLDISQAAEQITTSTGADLVQIKGHTIVVYRKRPDMPKSPRNAG